MTKTLTEQWRNEELPIDLYYVIDKLGRETIGNDCGIRDMMVDAFNGGNIFIREVLEPVPSYDEIKRLQKQLADANKLILSLKHHAICDFDRIIYGEYIDKWGVK